ncbi:uncharacterized protein PAC_03293 [Phialocephala subalpina]|uniref:Hydroxyneurosporene synthase (CrtC) n=1 Tax=Phialocephala subalpina TaxID=576137 RepID=A0A1L7WKW3_9HELO|nr:uncharacterized protein PAC_03293 [Phialocephala subalpina]
MKLLLPQWLLFATAVLAANLLRAKTKRNEIIPSTPFLGPITADFTSSHLGLDGPKLSAVNSTSFDWWYFDVVSTDRKSSLVVVFYTALPSAFPFLPASTDVTTVGIYIGFPNGTTTSTYLGASEAIVSTDAQGSTGNFVGTGAGWAGAEDDSVYEVLINSPSNGIFGSFNLVATAPAHYPCGPATIRSGQNLEVGPNIGWSNAVPDAVGSVALTVGSTKLAFTGVAYHDKNWSNQPFTDNVGSWYWGHGHIGGYSLVWFDFLAVNGTEYVSAYVSKNNKILASSCTPGSIKVRPTGANADYPPTVYTGNPGGFSILVDLNDGGEMSFNVSTDSIVAGAAGMVYTRWTGVLNGSLNGGKVMTGGAAIFEQFKLST